MFNIKRSFQITALILCTGISYVGAQETLEYNLLNETVVEIENGKLPYEILHEGDTLSELDEEQIELDETDFEEFDLLEEDFELPNW